MSVLSIGHLKLIEELTKFFERYLPGHEPEEYREAARKFAQVMERAYYDYPRNPASV